MGKSKKFLMVLALSASTLAVGLASFGSVALSAWFKNEASLPATVHVGDVVSIPDYTFSDGKKAMKKIRTPKGGLYSGDSFTVEEIGLYSVIYGGFAGDNETEVVKKVLSVRTASDLFDSNGKASVSHGVSSADSTFVGSLASFASDGVLTYKKTLDLSNATKDDLLFSFIVDPLSVGESALNDFSVSLKDVADDSNAIAISFVDSGPINCDGKGCYVKAGASGQIPGGWEGSHFLTNAIYGTPCATSFRGLGEAKLLSLYYDNSEKALYATQGWGAGEKSRTLIADFDSSSSFPNALWGGWTSGKVTLSISAGDLHASEASILFSSIGSMSFSSEDYPDTTAPSLRLLSGSETTIPEAVYGRAYPLFEASAEDDFDGDLQVQRAVYFLDTTSGQEVAIPTSMKEGKLYFTPELVGNYRVRYSASDRSGNETHQELPITGLASKKSIHLSLPTSDSEASVYSTVALDPLSQVGTKGGEGAISLRRILLDPDGEEVEVSKDSFVPEKVGVYTCRYIGTDYLLYEGYAERKITVKNLTDVTFIDEPTLPKVLINGFSYALPTLHAKEAKDASSTGDVTVETLLNGTKTTEDSFVASGSSVSLTYQAKTASKTYTLSVIDGQNGKDQAAYFVGDLGIKENKENIDLSATKDGSSYFANPLNPEDFSLSFAYEEGQENFASFALSIADSANPENVLTFHFFLLGSTLSVLYPGQKEAVSFPFVSGQATFNFHNATQYFSGSDDLAIAKVTERDDGASFAGFAGSVYLTLAFEGVSGSSLLHLTKLINQPLGYRAASKENAKDSIAPLIYVDNADSVKQSFGGKITLNSARCYDVLSDIKSFLVSVSAPDKSLLFDNVDAKKEYPFSLDHYGVYTVSYVVVDGANNKKSYSRLYRVDEEEAPVLEIKNTLQNAYKVGDKVALPSYSVRDNSGSCHLEVSLQLPSGERRLLLSSVDGTETSYLTSDSTLWPSSFKVDAHTFKLEESGNYILRYFAYDDYFNYVKQEFAFVCEA